MESDQNICLFEMLFAGKVILILTFKSIHTNKRLDFKRGNSLLSQSKTVLPTNIFLPRKTNNEDSSEYEESFDLSNS